MEEEEQMTTEEKRKKMVEGIVSAPADAVEKVYDEVGQSLARSAGGALGAAAGVAVGGPVGGVLGAVVGRKAAGKLTSEDGAFIAEGGPRQLELTPIYVEWTTWSSLAEWGLVSLGRTKYQEDR